MNRRASLVREISARRAIPPARRSHRCQQSGALDRESAARPHGATAGAHPRGHFGMLDHRVLVALSAAGVPEALTRKTDPRCSQHRSVSTRSRSNGCCGLRPRGDGCASIAAAGSVRPR